MARAQAQPEGPGLLLRRAALLGPHLEQPNFGPHALPCAKAGAGALVNSLMTHPPERPPYPHFGSPTSQGMSPKAKRPWEQPLPLALLSRRQYLSRMDRFQHGRSARTLGREGLEIN